MARPLSLAALNPLRCTGTELPPELLLAAKLVAFFLLWFRFPAGVPAPFLPFVPALDAIGHPVLVQRAIQSAAVLGAVGILFNVRPRAACLLLGSAILAKVLASRPAYYNNEVFCSALFLMIGLSEPARPTSLLRAQLALVYFGAGLNKLLDADWRSGRYFEVWTALIHQDTYLRVKALLPPLLLSRLACWCAIVTELALAALFATRSDRLAVALGLAFHSALVLFAGTTFGFFYLALLAAYLPFLEGPWGARKAASGGYIALIGLSLAPTMDVTWSTRALIVLGLGLFAAAPLARPAPARA